MTIAFGFENNVRFTGTTLTASTEEIGDPVSNLLSDVLGEVWSSAWEGILINSKGNKIDFTASGAAGSLVATVADGLYWKEEYAEATASAVNTAIVGGGGSGNMTGVWIDGTGYRFTRSSGTFTFLCATGANKRVSMYPILGFSCAADKTAVSTITSDRVVTTTGGNFAITTANQTWKYTDTAGRTATIAAADYTRLSILSEIKYQMDTASTVTDYDPHYLEASWHFKISKGAGTFTVDDPGNTFADVLGIPTGGGAAASIEATEERIHVEEWILIDTSLATPNFTVTMVGLFGFNFSSAAVVKFQSNATDSWSSPTVDETLTWNAKNIIHFPTSSQLRWIRILIQDRRNTAGRVYLGALYAGAKRELASDTKWERKYGARQLENVDSGQLGAIYGELVATLPEVGAVLIFSPTADRSAMEALRDATGTSHAFVWCWSTTTDVNENTEWGYMAPSHPGFTRVAARDEYHSDSFEIRRAA